MRYFLIDRLAAGFDEKTVCHQFRMFFEVPDSDADIMAMLSPREEIEKDIEARRQEILDDIEKTNITGMILKHIKRLDERSENVDDISDLVKITTVLTTSLATLRPRDAPAAGAKSLTVNYYNQFNATFIQDLETQDIIRIVDRKKFDQLFLGQGEAKGDDSPAVTSPPTMKEERKQSASLSHDLSSEPVSEPEPANSPRPAKKERAKPASPDDIASFL
jgi:hypothetical protein